MLANEENHMWLPNVGNDGMHLSGAADVGICGSHTALHVDFQRSVAL